MTDIEIKNLNELKQVMENYGSNYDFAMVEKAFTLCVNAHRGQNVFQVKITITTPLTLLKLLFLWVWTVSQLRRRFYTTL